MTKTFKTSINCSNCVRTVSGFLNDLEGISAWSVDTDNPNKILVVEGDATVEEIVAAVEEAGFDIAPE